MAQVKKGEEVPRWTKVDVDKKLVTKQHVTKHDVSGTYHLMTWTFDFSKLSDELILEMASRDAVITHRPAFKVCEVKDIPSWENKTFVVKSTVKLTPVERTEQMLEKLTPQQRDELLKKYQQK